MSRVAAREVRSFLLSTLERPLAALGVDTEELPDDFDLLTEGVIDSMGIVELIAAVEQRFGVQIDFADLDAEEFTVIGPFCRYVEERSNGLWSRTP